MEMDDVIEIIDSDSNECTVTGKSTNFDLKVMFCSLNLN